MRLLFAFAVAAAAVLSACASRDVGFGVDAANRAFPVGYQQSVVFSPASFELDCVVFAHTFDTLVRAKVTETLGAISGLDGVYAGVVEGLSARTNGFSFLAARAFVVPDIRQGQPKTRMFLADTYSTSVCSANRTSGVQAWLKAVLDGQMDDFDFSGLPQPENGQFAFLDLVSLRVAWRDPFPIENSKKLVFSCADGSRAELPFMADVRLVDACEGDKFSILKMPLRGDAVFFALLPNKGCSIADVRAKVSSQTIQGLLHRTDSLVEKGVYHGPAAVVLPVFDLTSQIEFGGVLRYFGFPGSGYKLIAGSSSARSFVQRVRFRLEETAEGEAPLQRKRSEDVTSLTADAKRFVFDRPFLFFVYHSTTETMPVVGQFTGLRP